MKSSLRSRLERCRGWVFDAEVPEIQARSRWARALLFLLLLVMSIAITRESLLPANSEGWKAIAALGADGNVAKLPESMFSSASVHELFNRAFLPLLLLCTAIRFAIVLLGPLAYRRSTGVALPLQFAVAIALASPFTEITSYLALSAWGGIAWLAGFGFEAGSQLVNRVSEGLGAAINSHVPNLIEIPYPWPLVAAEIPAGLGYYWFHRLQHTWRPLWLFTHRTHHISTHLTTVTTLPAKDPLGFALAPIVEGLLVGVLVRLFSSQSMVAESILFSLLTFTASEAFNHNEPTYAWTLRGPLRRLWFNFTGWGAYHLVHHSSQEKHRLANIGGGPFMLWDRVFGTYYRPPELKPPMGLTGRPQFWMNPVRIALASYLEVLAELRLNRRWRDRCRILFGSIHYLPPVQVTYLLKEPAANEERLAA